MRLALYQRQLKSPAQAVGQSGLPSILLLLLLHIGLAFLFREMNLFSTIHAILVLVVGLYTALTSKDLARVVPFVAYIMGAEVLWRMTKAGVFWEYGKYAIVLLLLVALIKQRKPIKNFFFPLLSFLLLLPSALLTIEALGFTERSREFISFNLSGPLAVFMCVIFFSQVTINQEMLKKTVWAAVYPIIGILTIAVMSSLTAAEIYFGTESIFETSGGFGPNQVSAVLGLGALLLILYAIQPSKFVGRTLAIVVSLLLIVQSFLTFSRGGIINLAVALGAAFIFLLRRPGKIIRPLFVLFIILIVVGYVVFPQLEALTGGALSARFMDLDPVSRVDIAKQDIELFQSNPIAGVGPGMATNLRSGVSMVAAHTEYSRVLAEHGILGALSFLILIFMLFRSLLKTPSAMAQAWIVASAGWAAVEMAHAAMRIVAISVMLGFAFITFDLEDLPPVVQEHSSSRYKRFYRYQKRKNVN